MEAEQCSVVDGNKIKKGKPKNSFSQLYFAVRGNGKLKHLYRLIPFSTSRLLDKQRSLNVPCLRGSSPVCCESNCPRFSSSQTE